MRIFKTSQMTTFLTTRGDRHGASVTDGCGKCKWPSPCRPGMLARTQVSSESDCPPLGRCLWQPLPMIKSFALLFAAVNRNSCGTWNAKSSQRSSRERLGYGSYGFCWYRRGEQKEVMIVIESNVFLLQMETRDKIGICPSQSLEKPQNPGFSLVVSALHAPSGHRGGSRESGRARLCSHRTCAHHVPVTGAVCGCVRIHVNV